MAKKTAAKAALSVKARALSAAEVKKAQACLAKSGKVQIGFKEVSFTRLPKSISLARVFID
jgi:hypothetical protein